MPSALLVAVLAALSVLLGAMPVAAHDPIFLADDQKSPDVGPYMPDGSISWALYGQVLEEGDTRGFEFDLRDGDELYVSLLIPNIEPEVALADADLPVLELELPDGSIETIVATERTVFDEPFSGTSYVTLAEIQRPGEAGRYRGVVIGAAPSRFSVAIGIEEIFFTETERSGDRPSSFMEMAAPLTAWYSTPPGEETVVDGAGVQIDTDMIDEAMEDGIASDSRAEATGAAGDDPVEAAAATADRDGQDDSGLALLAPAVVLLAAAGGGAFLLMRRRQRSVARNETS